jgi:hypothetical protein
MFRSLVFVRSKRSSILEVAHEHRARPICQGEHTPALLSSIRDRLAGVGFVQNGRNGRAWTTLARPPSPTIEPCLVAPEASAPCSWRMQRCRRAGAGQCGVPELICGGQQEATERGVCGLPCAIDVPLETSERTNRAKKPRKMDASERSICRSRCRRYRPPTWCYRRRPRAAPRCARG